MNTLDARGSQCHRYPRCSSWSTSSPNCSVSIPSSPNMFVAIGRLGRSLGMHLLLASQRLDEGRPRGLETHLSYRICLKTFSASESRAVLGVSDAYHLPTQPGAAYLKTAAGAVTRFQTTFVSGGYTPRPHLREPADRPVAQLFTLATAAHADES